VTDVINRAYATDSLDALSQPVMAGDGAMGTQLQAADLTETKYVRLQIG
jgi:5-methyltetrahydrofolate--homocysteine methyltransferase